MKTPWILLTSSRGVFNRPANRLYSPYYPTTYRRSRSHSIAKSADGWIRPAVVRQAMFVGVSSRNSRNTPRRVALGRTRSSEKIAWVFSWRFPDAAKPRLCWSVGRALPDTGRHSPPYAFKSSKTVSGIPGAVRKGRSTKKICILRTTLYTARRIAPSGRCKCVANVSLLERPSRTIYSSAFDRHRDRTGRLELEQPCHSTNSV